MFRRGLGLLALGTILAFGLGFSGRPGKTRTAGDPAIVTIDTPPLPGGGAPPIAGGIAANGDGSWIFAPSPDALRLLKVDSSSGAVLSSIAFASPISLVKKSPGGALLAVVSSSASTVTLVSTADLSQGATLVTGSGPAGIGFSPDSSMLYVACGGSRQLQVFDLTTSTLLRAVEFESSPTDVACLGDGARLAVALFESISVPILDAETLATTGVISVPPGSRHLYAPPPTGGPGVVLISSELSDSVTIADAVTLNVLKVLSLEDAGPLAGAPSLYPYVLVERGSRKVDAYCVDPLDARFAKPTCTLFSGIELSGLDVAPETGRVTVQTADRGKLVTMNSGSWGSAYRTDQIIPPSGLPGSQVSATGAYGSGDTLSAPFMQKEAFIGVQDPSNLNPTSFDVEVPLECPPGTVQLWVSANTRETVSAGTFIASSPTNIVIVETLEAIDATLAKLELLLADPNTTPDAAAQITAALQSLKKARTLFQGGAGFKQGLLAISDAFDALSAAAIAGLNVGRLPRSIAEIVQYSVYTKVRAAKSALGAEDEDVKAAQLSFDSARGLMRKGNFKDAIGSYLKSYDSIEKALLRARLLRGAQVARILKRAMSGILSVQDGVKGRLMGHAHGAAKLKPTEERALEQAATLLGARPDGRLKGTALGDFAQIRVYESMLKIEAAVAQLAGSHVPSGDLQAQAARTVLNLVLDTANAVESNVGPFDPTVLKARNCAAEAAAAIAKGDISGAMTCLLQAMGDAPTSTSGPSAKLKSSTVASPSAQLFMASGTGTEPCVPRIKVLPIPAVCLDTNTGATHPSPIPIKCQVTSSMPGDFGLVFVTIYRGNGNTVVRQLEDQFVTTPATPVFNWDGKDNAGNTVTMKGLAKQDTFVAKALFVCLSSEGEAPSDRDSGNITVTATGGLVIVPAEASICASTTTHEVTKQFKAYRCQPGGGELEDVTDRCSWSLDNASIGKIDPNSGLFTAAVAAKGRGTVTAVLYETGERGEADIEIVPESGGIVPSKVTLCPRDSVQFHVVKGCDADDEGIVQNNADYVWTVVPANIGTITVDGEFTAVAKGSGTVTATNGSDTFNASVTVGDVDDIDIIEAPFLFHCETGGSGKNFTVQVFCNGMPVDGINVAFGGSGETNLAPLNVMTAGGGLATTVVTPTGTPSPSINGTTIKATASGLTKTANLTVIHLKALAPLYNFLTWGQTGIWKATFLPPGSDALIPDDPSWILEDPNGNVLSVQAGGAEFTFKHQFDNGIDNFGVTLKGAKLTAKCKAEAVNNIFDMVDISVGYPTSNMSMACPDEPFTFTAFTNPPGYENQVLWDSPGIPAIGTGQTFKSRFPSPAIYEVTAKCGPVGRKWSVFVRVSPGVQLSIPGLDEDQKLTPGAWVVVNDDHDNHTKQPDLRVKSIPDEVDLLRIVLRDGGFSQDSLVLARTGGSGQIKVWKKQTKEVEVPLPAIILPSDHSQGVADLYIEGISPGDVQLTLTHAEDATCADMIKVNVYHYELRGHRLTKNDVPASLDFPEVLNQFYPANADLLLLAFGAVGGAAESEMKQLVESYAMQIRIDDPTNPAPSDTARLGSGFQGTDHSLNRVGTVFTSAKPILPYQGDLDDATRDHFSNEYELFKVGTSTANSAFELSVLYHFSSAETRMFTVQILAANGQDEIFGDIPRAEYKEIQALIDRKQLGIASTNLILAGLESSFEGPVESIVTLASMDPLERIKKQTFRVRIVHDFETEDTVTLPMLIGNDRLDVQFTRDPITKQLTSQQILAVRGAMPQPVGVLQAAGLAIVASQDKVAIKIQDESYEKFRDRKLADVYNLYLYGHKVTLQDRMQALISAYDGNYSERNYVLDPVPDMVIDLMPGYVPIENRAAGGKSESDRESKLQGEFSKTKVKLGFLQDRFLDQYGPWDPHSQEVLPVIKENLTPAIFADKRVAIISHGASEIWGGMPGWDAISEDLLFTTQADAAKVFDLARNRFLPQPRFNQDAFYDAAGNPVRPKEIFCGACNAWAALINPVIGKNKNAQGQKRWTAPISGVDGTAHLRFIPVLNFKAGVNEATKLRLASRFSSLFLGVGMQLQNIDLKAPPATLTVTFMSAQRPNGQPSPNGPAAGSNFTQDATNPFLYRISWKDPYDNAVMNEAVLEFTKKSMDITEAGGGIQTLVQAKLTDPAHGIIQPFTFWLQLGATKMSSAIAAAYPGAGGGFEGVVAGSIVGPQFRNVAAFAKAWRNVLEGSSDVTQAYWDCVYLDGYVTPREMPQVKIFAGDNSTERTQQRAVFLKADLPDKK